MRQFALLFLLWCATVASGRVLAQDKTLTVRSIAESPSFAKRALVIGVGQYEHAGSLAPTTYNDARRFADLLKTQFKFPDEAITLLTDAPGTPNSQHPTFIHLRNAFKTLLAGLNDKSEVVVYFSGHGTRAEDHDWLVPMDGLPSDVNATCINYDEFKSQLNTRTPARALLIVDACRNLSGGKDAGSSGFGAGKGLAGPQFAELLSCRPKEESKVGKPVDFEESVFTHYLLQGLRGDTDAQDNGVVTFDSLNEYVQGRVSQYVSSKFGEAQNPEGRASLGKMVLAKGPNVVKPLVASPQAALNSPLANPEKPVLPGGGGRKLTGAIRPVEAQAGDMWVNPKDGAEMVYIPAGPFIMGDDGIFKNLNPRRTVTLSGYWIYKNVVTVGMYKRFCQETGAKMPDFPGYNPDWSKEDHPVVWVTWENAMTYCQWAGVSLPTEAQWEKAARGIDGRTFPWGDTFDQSKVWDIKNAGTSRTRTTAVGKYGLSVYGCSDMAGNVIQWCADEFMMNGEKYHNTRGSSYEGHAVSVYCASRGGGSGPNGSGNLIGFRCASGL